MMTLTKHRQLFHYGIYNYAKEIAYFTFLFLIQTSIFSQASAPTTLPDATQGIPGKIASASDLIWLSQNSAYWDDNWEQTADISFPTDPTAVDWDDDGSIGSSGDALGSSMIGNSTTKFTGNYNGNGYMIENLFINRPTENVVGLFGYTDNATLYNIELKNVDIIGLRYVGGLVGSFSYQTISNCYVSGRVESKYAIPSVSDFSGLLTGNTRNATIINCGVQGVVESQTGAYCTGGITGQNYMSTIQNCYAAATTNDAPVVGHNHHSHSSYNIDLYYNSDVFTGAASTNGTALTEAQFSNSSNFTSWDFEGTWEIATISSISPNARPYLKHQIYPYQLSITSNVTLAAGILPPTLYLNSNSGTVVTAKNVVGYTFDHWEDETENTLASTLDFTVPNGFFSTGNRTIKAIYNETHSLDGTGISTDPFLIKSLTDLIFLSNTSDIWDKHFKVNNDIDCGNDYNTVDWNGNGLTGDSEDALGFCPIAFERGTNGELLSFTGVFDGNNKTIRHLFIERPTGEYIGLFSNIESATISNLTLDECSIKGDYYVGCLVGNQLAISTTTPSLIENCKVTSSTVEALTKNCGGVVGFSTSTGAQISNTTVINTKIVGPTQVGGISGSFSGKIDGCEVIATPDFGTSITINGYYGGGIVGFARDAASINACHTDVSVQGQNYTGGIAGVTYDASITECYSVGDISGTSYIGGIVGRTDHSSDIIDGCFSSSLVSGTSALGGICGLSECDLFNSYATGAVNGSSSVGGIAGWVVSNNNSTAISRIKYSYSSASVIGNSDCGAIIGNDDNNYGSDLEKIYYNKESSAMEVNGIGDIDDNLESSEIIALSATEFSNSSNFTGLSFGSSLASPWETNSNGPPLLYWQQSRHIPVVCNETITTNTNRSVSINATLVSNGAAITETGVRWRRASDTEWQYANGSISGSSLSGTTGEINVSGYSYAQSYVKDNDGNYYYGAILLQGMKYSGGEGTSTNPYIIAIPEDLIELSNTSSDWGAHFIQIADIDFGSDPTQFDWDDDGTLASTEDAAGFQPIGISTSSFFSGTYHGYSSDKTTPEQRTINHLYINRPSTDFIGLFGAIIGTNAKISHITLKDNTLTGKNYIGPLAGLVYNGVSVSECQTENSTVVALNYAGGLVGKTYTDVTYKYCKTKDAHLSAETYYVGGLAARLDGNCEISNCEVENISASCKILYCGGITGYMKTECKISNSSVLNFQTHDADPTAENGYTGGITGYASNATITNCNVSADNTFTGKVSCRYNVGGIVGLVANGGMIDSCSVDGLTLEVHLSDGVGGLIGNASTSSVSMKVQNSSVNNCTLYCKRNYAGGAIGYLNDTHSISKCKVTNSNISTDGSYAGGFVGRSSNNSFIEDCSNESSIIEGGGSYIGGFVGQLSNASIINSKTKSVQVTTSNNYTGGFVGINDGGSSIIHCVAEDVKVKGKTYTGGFVGRNYLAEISTSSSTGEVTSTSSYLGGFAGYNQGGTISQCYSTTDVLGDGNNYLGGFSGLNAYNAIIKDSYATGKVDGGLTTSSYVAGFVGSMSNTYPLENCYYARDGGNSVSAVGTNINPFIAYTTSTDVTTTGYYANNTVSNSSGDPVVSGDGSPLSPTAMETEASFSGFNFVDIWGISTVAEISSSPRPYLLSQLKEFQVSTISSSVNGGIISGEGFYNNGEMVTLSAAQHSDYHFSHFEVDDIPVTTVGSGNSYTFTCSGNLVVNVVYELQVPFQGTGTLTDPYLIENFEELRSLSQMSEVWDKHFKLVNDVNCLEEASNTVSDYSLVDWDKDGNADGINTLGFSPIGTRKVPFSGTFVSDGTHTISNIYINRPQEGYVGLFGYVYGTTADSVVIENIALTDASLVGSTYTAGLVGYGYRMSINQCSVEGNIEGKGYTGGLIGYGSSSSITNSNTSITVNTISQDSYTGGLIGSATTCSINHCTATGQVSTLGYTSGGLIGSLSGLKTTNDCHSYVDITASSEAHIGGFVGLSNSGVIISNCSSQGDVRGASYTGGFVGSHYGGTLKSCFATGNVYAGSRVGAFVGFARNTASIKDCYCIGAIYGSSMTGGFAGHVQDEVSIENVYSAGSIELPTSGAWGGTISATGSFFNLFYNNDFTKNTTQDVTLDQVGMEESVSGLSTEAFKLQAAFSGFSKGTGTDTPWQFNAQGRPYLYWQGSEIIVDNSITSGSHSSDYQFDVNFIATGSVNIIEKGLCFYASEATRDPLNSTYTYKELPISGGQMNLSSSELTLGNYYYIRAYAKGDNGLFYYGESFLLQANDFDGGNGTEADPFQIRTLEQLKLLSENSTFWSSSLYFIQTADIDATATSSWNSGEGFLPIGRGSSSPTGVTGAFYGNYDGRGHSISNLTINRPTEPYCGMFGLTLNATISDLELNDVSVSGDDRIGGIVGYLYTGSTLQNCSVDGTVSGPSGYCNLGLAVGYAYSSEIYNCRASGTVNSTYTYSGGLLGRHNRSQMYNSYAVTSGMGTDNALVGYCYASGTAEYATVDSSFFENSDGRTNDVPGVRGLSAAEFGDTSNFPLWDFDNTWEEAIVNSIDATTQRPYLKFQVNTYRLELKSEPTFGGNGNFTHSYFDTGDSLKLVATPAEGYIFTGWTYENGSSYSTTAVSNSLYNFSSDMTLVANFAVNHVWECGNGSLATPYCIKDYEDLNALSTLPLLWSKHFYLANDIDASASEISDNGKGFLPIAFGSEFTGSIDGKGFKISNLNIRRNNTTDVNIGLISSLQNGVVKDLTLENCHIEGYNYVGGIAGQNSGTTGDVSISNCHVTGEISGYSRTGGIVGSVSTTTMRENSAEMTITGQSSYTGGIAGYTYSYTNIIESCFDGEISGQNLTGAIAGYLYYSTIDSCYSNATITGNNQVGGIVGYNYYRSEVKHCDFSGKITGNESVGGIVGEQKNTEAKTHINHFGGMLTGNTYVGGIVGKNTTSALVQNCYSTGATNGSGEHIGGIVGYNMGSAIKSCYSRGLIYKQTTGAIAGTNELNSSISNCYSDIDITLQNELININNAIPSHTQNNNTLNSTEFSGGKSYFPYLDFGTTDDAPWQIDSMAQVGSLSTKTISLYEVGTMDNNLDQGMIYTTPYLGHQEVVVSNDVPVKATGSNLKGDVYEFTTANILDKRTDKSTSLETGVRKFNPLTLEWEYFPGQNTIEATSDTVIWQYYVEDTETEQIYSGNAIILVIEYSGGDGSIEAPYQIEDAYDLITLSNSPDDWNKEFYQVDDILFTVPSEFGSSQQLWSDIDGNDTVSADEIDFNMDGDFTNEGLGFFPIGNLTTKFTGNYKGKNVSTSTDQSYLIDNLYINRTSTDSVGLFGASSNITDISYIDFTNGYVSGRYYVGMCCGAGTLSLSRIQTDGVVIGQKRVGGILGSMEGGAGSIVECGNNATVINNGTSSSNNEGQHTGGIAGYIMNGIKNCYNAGYVYSSKTRGGNTGGISGTSKDTIISCYSSGAVSGRTNVGGITGQNQNTIEYVSASGFVSGSLGNTGAITGKSNEVDSEVLNAVYDTTTVLQDTAISNGLGNATVSQLNTSDYNIQATFPFRFGNTTTTPWILNSNTHGRPYFYWQDDATVSNPFPKYTELGFDADATYTGTLQSHDPLTPEITNKGVRITKINSNGEASWNDVDWAWNHIYTDSISLTTFTTIQENFFDEDDEFLVQPFVINTNGQKRYGDMVKMKARYLLTVLTLRDSDRDMRSTTLNGEISTGSNVMKYGVLYSQDTSNLTLDSLYSSLPKVKSISKEDTKGIDANLTSPLNFSLPLNVGDLENRKGYYTRAYAIDESGSIGYGKVKRFITEKRDFSLQLDGSSALLVDEGSTTDYINDWSSNTANEFSIDFWIMDEDSKTTEEVILDNHNDNSGYIVSLGADRKINLKSHNNDVVSSDSAISDSLWHYVSITYNGNQASIYLDGKISTSAIILLKPTAMSNKLCIGAEIDGLNISNTFTGKIDALHFWNTTLNSSQVSKLCYDNIQKSSNTKVELKGSGIEISDLAWDNLTAAIGFNVKSTLESTKTVVPADYNDESQGLDYPFFSEEGRDQFNLIAIGSPVPSLFLPRTNWSFKATNTEWLTETNWSSFAYPGEGISTSELSTYKDITNNAIDNSGDFCQYTIINKVDATLNNKPILKLTSPFIHYLIDYDKAYGSYKVDNTNGASLIIKNGVITDLFESESGMLTEGESYLKIESGSIEVE